MTTTAEVTYQQRIYLEQDGQQGQMAFCSCKVPCCVAVHIFGSSICTLSVNICSSGYSIDESHNALMKRNVDEEQQCA